MTLNARNIYSEKNYIDIYMLNYTRLNKLQIKNVQNNIAEFESMKTPNNKYNFLIDVVIQYYKDRRIVNKRSIANLIKIITSDKKNKENLFLKKLSSQLTRKPTKPQLKKQQKEQQKIKELEEEIELKSRAKFSITVILYTEKAWADYQRNTKYGFQMAPITTTVTSSKKFLEELFLRKVVNFNKIDISKEEEKYISKIYEMMCTDEDFKKRYDTKKDFLQYITAFRLIYFFQLPNNKQPAVPIKKQFLKDTAKENINHKYVITDIDLVKDTFEDAIKHDNYVANECWLNAIYDTYGNKFSRDKILNAIGKDDITEGISIEEASNFFVRYNLRCRIINEFNKAIYTYDPEHFDRNNRVFFGLVKNNHIYTINYNKDILKEKIDSGDYFELWVSPDFHTNETKETHHIMIENSEDIYKIMKEQSEKQTENTKIYLVVKDNDLVKLLKQLYEMKLQPQINYNAGNINRLVCSFRNSKIITTFVIRTQQLVPDMIDGFVCVNDEEVYNNMNREMTKFKNALFNKNHKSFYTDDDIEVFKSYRTIPNLGYFQERANNDLVEIDIKKAYTFALSHIDKIPIFNEFDIFKKYEGEKVEDYNLYIIRYTKKDTLMFNKSYNLVYGKFLIKFPDAEILYVKSPSFVHKVDYKKIINKLYNSTISNNESEDIYIKKLIANVNIGMLEKSQNKVEQSYLYDDIAEAQYYQTKCGGNINVLQHFKSYLDSNLDIDDIEVDGNPFYILKLSTKTELRNGFRFIKELLLQTHNYYLNKSYQKLSKNNIKVYSVKTDSLTILKTDLDKARQLIKFGDKIGDWTLHKTDDINYPFIKFDFNFAIKKPVIKEYVQEELKIEDEYNSEEFHKVFKEHKKVIVRAEYAGCGKSSSCKSLQDFGYRVLMICPTNKLLRNHSDVESVTLNKFFGYGVDDNVKMKKFDDSPYDVIIFDEIYFTDIKGLRKIYKYSLNNDKIILATGDINQLESVEQISNNKNYDEYLNHCINMIFPYYINLQEIKRVKDNEQKEKLKQISYDILHTDIPVDDIIKKYKLKTTNKLCMNNLAFTNKKCESVSNQVRQGLGKPQNEYEVGEILTCKKHFKNKKYTLHVNYEYKIKGVSANNIILIDETTKEEFNLFRKFVDNHFIWSYCTTVHSCQGSSVDGKVIIHEYNHFYSNRKWIYTAVTRTTNINNVYFFKE
jgi:hypothetical protein